MPQDQAEAKSKNLQSESSSSVLFAAGAVSGITEALVVQPFGNCLKCEHNNKFIYLFTFIYFLFN